MNIKLYKLKSYDDKRGSLIEILREDKIQKKIAQIYTSFSIKGIIRGGHFHKRKTEWFTILKGRANFYFKDMISFQEKVYNFTDKDLILIEVPPFVFHKIEILEDQTILLIIVDEVYIEEDNDTFN